jgi:hypothetical protein
MKREKNTYLKSRCKTIKMKSSVQAKKNFCQYKLSFILMQSPDIDLRSNISKTVILLLNNIAVWNSELYQEGAVKYLTRKCS